MASLTQFACQLFKGRAPGAGQGDSGTGCMQCRSNGAADTAGCAGNQCAFSSQIKHIFFILLGCNGDLRSRYFCRETATPRFCCRCWSESCQQCLNIVRPLNGDARQFTVNPANKAGQHFSRPDFN